MGNEHVKLISNHVNKHLKLQNDEQFGHYLAGLIDGDGYFGKTNIVKICFNSPDAFLAYYLKKRLGYGSVKKIKNNKAFLLTISKKEATAKVINLINGKIRLQHRFDQIINNILASDTGITPNIPFTRNTSNDFNNHWLAGFTDAQTDGSFQIKFINKIGRNKPEVALNFQVDQKKEDILKKIKTFLGGNIGLRKPQDSYYYGSTSFGSAKKVIHYFDSYHLQSSKYISYLRWRKAYILISNKQHLNEKGLAKLTIICSILNRHCSPTI